jgi:His-Xaa-Ser system protein HxsD
MAKKIKSGGAAIKRVVKAPRASPGEIAFEVDARRDGPEPVLGAAYLLMDRAYAFVSGDKSKFLTVTLRPKGSRGAAELAALKRTFEDELAAQKLRWTIARNNRSVREYVAENAVALAKEFSERTASTGPAAAPSSEQLTDEQRSEIERLISEVETEIAEMNAKTKAKVGDLSGAAVSWEAAQKAEKEGPAA